MQSRDRRTARRASVAPTSVGRVRRSSTSSHRNILGTGPLRIHNGSDSTPSVIRRGGIVMLALRNALRHCGMTDPVRAARSLRQASAVRERSRSRSQRRIVPHDRHSRNRQSWTNEPKASFPVFIDEGVELRIERRIACHRVSQGNTDGSIGFVHRQTGRPTASASPSATLSPAAFSVRCRDRWGCSPRASRKDDYSGRRGGGIATSPVSGRAR